MAVVPGRQAGRLTGGQPPRLRMRDACNKWIVARLSMSSLVAVAAAGEQEEESD